MLFIKSIELLEIDEDSIHVRVYKDEGFLMVANDLSPKPIEFEFEERLIRGRRLHLCDGRELVVGIDDPVYEIIGISTRHQDMLDDKILTLQEGLGELSGVNVDLRFIIKEYRNEISKIKNMGFFKRFWFMISGKIK